MVFDDVMLKDQTIIGAYFCTQGYNNENVFYLVQSLHKIQKHCIRDNVNIFILFHHRDKTLKYFYEDMTSLKYFYEDMISRDMDFKEFKCFCHKEIGRAHV